jgi:hypothetical protein
MTKFAVFFQERGVAHRLAKQIAGILIPDGQFHWGAQTYNVEVECSTLAKALGQVIRNVKNSRAAGHPVLIVLPDREMGPMTPALLYGTFPGLGLWTDGVGLVWKKGRATFRAQRVPGTPARSFLDSEGGADTPDAETHPVAPLPETDPLPGFLRSAIRDLVAAGKTEATSRELLASLSPAERGRRTDEQVGITLSAMGLKHHRLRTGYGRIRVYDLLSVAVPGVGNHSQAKLGPAGGPAVETRPAANPSPRDVSPRTLR